MKTEEKLHTLRKQKGITQAELAEIMDVSRQAVSRWESGIVIPSIENLKRLSSLYGVPLDYLLNEKEDDNSLFQNDESSIRLSVGSENQSQEEPSFDNKENDKKKKWLVIGLLLGIAAIFIIVGILISTARSLDERVQYNEMDHDKSWSYSSSNESFDLQWY